MGNRRTKGRFVERLKSLKSGFEEWFSKLSTGQAVTVYASLAFSLFLIVAHNPTGGYERLYQSRILKEESDFEEYGYEHDRVMDIWVRATGDPYSDYKPVPPPSEEELAEARVKWATLQEEKRNAYHEYLTQVEDEGWTLLEGDEQSSKSKEAIRYVRFFTDPRGWRSKNAMHPPLFDDIGSMSVFLKLMIFSWAITWFALWLIGIRHSRSAV